MSKLYGYNGNAISLDMLTNLVDVTGFGAKGDGTTDDASAIQSALDSVKNTGGIIYFPYGTYRITTAVLFYSNQTLLFADGAVLLRGDASLNNMMRNYNTSDITEYNGTHDVKIIGATFDGNASYTTISPSLLGFCHAKNISIIGCKFKNAYGSWHDIEVNSSQYVLIENCEFDGSAKAGDGGENIQLDYAGSSSYYPWTCNMDNTVSSRVEINSCKFYGNTVSPAIGNHSGTASGNYVRIHDCFFDTNTVEDNSTRKRGTIALNTGGMIDVYNNTFFNCTKCFYTGATGNKTFHDNRVVGATTMCEGSNVAQYNNLVDGTLTD